MYSGLGEVRKTVSDESHHELLKAPRQALGAALDDIEKMVEHLTQHLLDSGRNPDALYKIGLGSVPFLKAFGDFLVGWRLTVAAEIAARACDTPSTKHADRGFYQGKIAVAAFFASSVLPHIAATRCIVVELDTSLMELDRSAW
ncbi:acyl-CoA dehydrogenase C-terminal domain-containing protein [Rhodococcus sp. G-MC3]|uniref:acyl-CoA dehydrogenase C-terminal domain-containing protein n=1 Tax=Rhodococcus sp. G-MC3 TaxID=3046209 RepID=UPI0024B99BE1|nr:acyl-CoA dehydrogenase C-terminal domain-containing protein [Rhodococcus sp. G-MC3]MDJ0394584.1 acyl-CoA dehydrogenase C-terminal domain-containing protein [Rhodococcus sp. G-MC3]